MSIPTPTTCIRAAAPAKLNLYLHVLGRRPDGYHELDSLVAFTDLADLVEIRLAEAFSLSIDGPFAAPLLQENPESNLVTKAVRMLAVQLGRSPAVNVRLTKRLPVAGGIGGGSSDAAATLRALARLWDLPPDDRNVAAVAPRLGADVPVCLFGRTAYFGGVGDLVEPGPALPPGAVLLVNPGVAQPTSRVFAERKGPYGSSGRLSRAPADAKDLACLLAERRNDLAEAAIGLAPEIADVIARIDAADGCMFSRMSGSGATCFGLFPDLRAAESAARSIAADNPGWWVAAGMLSDEAATVTAT